MSTPPESPLSGDVPLEVRALSLEEEGRPIPSDLTWHVITRMRELRTQRGISALMLERLMAEEAGVVMTRAVIANMETGRRRDISVDQLVGLARVFRTDVLHLLGLGGFECAQCHSEPPAGFSCMACGAQG